MYYEFYLKWARSIKIIISLLIAVVVYTIVTEKMYLQKKAVAEMASLFFSALAYYFPYEVSDFSGFQRFYNSDVVTKPHWWVEIIGLIGVVVSSYIILF